MHQFTLNFTGSWHLCHLSPEILILSSAHEVHVFSTKTFTATQATKPLKLGALDPVR